MSKRANKLKVLGSKGSATARAVPKSRTSLFGTTY